MLLNFRKILVGVGSTNCLVKELIKPQVSRRLWGLKIYLQTCYFTEKLRVRQNKNNFILKSVLINSYFSLKPSKIRLVLNSYKTQRLQSQTMCFYQ